MALRLLSMQLPLFLDCAQLDDGFPIAGAVHGFFGADQGGYRQYATALAG